MSGKTWVFLMVTGAVMAGCHRNQPPAPDRADAFASEPAVSPSQQLLTAQAATGAREDATLRAMHFDGGRLNSLGRQKLDLITRDNDGPRKLVVYLDLPSDAPLAEARTTVADFLKSAGIPDSQIRIEDGPNPLSTAPAARAMDDLHRVSSADDKKDKNDTSRQYLPLAQPQANDAMRDVSNH